MSGFDAAMKLIKDICEPRIDFMVHCLLSVDCVIQCSAIDRFISSVMKWTNNIDMLFDETFIVSSWARPLFYWSVCRAHQRFIKKRWQHCNVAVSLQWNHSSIWYRWIDGSNKRIHRIVTFVHWPTDKPSMNRWCYDSIRLNSKRMTVCL